MTLFSFIILPASTPTDLTAQLTSQITDPGTLAVIVLVAAIPLFFYVVKKLIALIPKDKAEPKTEAKPPTKEEMARLHKQYEFWEKPIKLPK